MTSRYALVLGASGGIGKEIVRKLASQGWSIYVHYHKNKMVMEELSREFEDHPVQLFPVHADLTDGDSVDALVDQIHQVHAIIHAGGVAYSGLFEDTTDEVMEHLWKVHVQQPARLIRHLLPKMRRAGGGSIVLISSIWGETGASLEVMYSTVKGAQNAFVKALGKELAPSFIRVNAVAPGAVDTAIMAAYSEEDRALINDEIPSGRMAQPEEIAGAVAYLVSDEASYVTSHILSINGGWYA
ncbi:elongation factor P 5-aminopentanone reductase [Jeotgalibacillus soli]|uniref:3-ketoacyl-ACP reductase n=1 Tax=Jeotgalibacillus soli TaxID=889306 RepID=A0A0C2R3W2_9BACL|nr:SDR family oxidoreductase [Jeotgalibacillus soli]KIL44950.1 3-ketoacyl-ACP reductase [Jeotgalibacillus soli]